MLFLQFRIGADLLALAAEAIVEIVPLTTLRQMRGGQASFDYRGRFVPVVDLSLRDTGIPAPRRMSTRIVVVRDAHGGCVGLIAPNATTMLRLDPADFAPFATGPDGLVQRVDLRDLLPRGMAA